MKYEINYEMGNEAQTVTQRNQPEGDGNITWKLNSGNYFMWPWGGNLNIRVTGGLLKYVSWQSFCEPVALGITVHSLRKSNIFFHNCTNPKVKVRKNCQKYVIVMKEKAF